MPTTSDIAGSLPSSGIRRFFDIVARTKDAISLGVGEPDFVTPWAFREAAIYSLERGQTSYTDNSGILELRQGISRHLSRLYAVDYDPNDSVLITVGVSEGMDLAMRAILNPGDEVLIAEPCYVSYTACVRLAGGVPVGIPTTEASGYVPTLAQLRAALTPRTKAILLGFPSNPTGAVLNASQGQEFVRFAVENDLFIVSDEIYDRLTYDSPHVFLAGIEGAKDRTILLNGFSKAYAMTGWRLGYACGPEPLIGLMTKIHSYTMLCAPITAQKAALEAIRNGEQAVQEMVGHYNRRRRLIVAGLNEIGLTCHMPQGAFYAFPSIRSTGLSSDDFAELLLQEEKVAVVPGTAFGSGGEGHIRCSYATSVERIEAALLLISHFVARHQAAASPKAFAAARN